MNKYLYFVIFLLSSTLSEAYDSYDPATGILHMPVVKVGSNSYEVTMLYQGDFIFKVTLATPTTKSIPLTDSFNAATGALNIPDVSVSTDNYVVNMMHQGDLVFKLISANPVKTQGDFNSKTIASNLDFPYEIIFGPDNNLWLTERTGKKVTHINLQNGKKKTLLTISEVYQSAGQDGLLGMVLHPNFLSNTDENYIYLAYTYSKNGDDNGRQLKIRRYKYNGLSQSLSEPVDLISGLSASNDHNGGRLVFGKDEKLYYSIGDQGANQFANKCTEIKAQRLPTQFEITNKDWISYQGKILRINLDGSIPEDNPFIDGVQSHIFSYGHRNPQGLVVANGRLYSAEHGPKTDDEINIISSGGNYGWPNIAGFQDDKAYEYCNWSSATNCSSLNYSDYSCPMLVQPELETSWVHQDFMKPLKTFFTVDADFDFQDPPGECSSAFICWPSIAPSSIDHYNPEVTIPGWNNSLLLTSLKKGQVYRVKVDSKGVISKNFTTLWQTQNRYRDIAIHPDGNTFYIATDSSGQTSGVTGGSTSNLLDPGVILEFSYKPF